MFLRASFVAFLYIVAIAFAFRSVFSTDGILHSIIGFGGFILVVAHLKVYGHVILANLKSTEG
jgi:hypothetical protein